MLYGVVGEGMGHATRSAVILKHLVKHHEVRVVVSGRAHQFLKRQFANVTEIHGLSMVYEENRVDRGRTLLNLIKRLPDMLNDNFDQFLELGEQFGPHAVIADFETFAYLFGKHHDLPVISIDNMQVINRCQLDVEIAQSDEFDFQTTKAIVKSKLPGCYHYLITSFFFPPLRKPRTSLFPPILRQQILEAPPTRGDHLLVYQTSTTNTRLLELLAATDLPARVYGLGRAETRGKLELKAFSEDGFIRDLASCRGVLATGGYSLMGEAIYLGKPVLAVPLQRQFEQQLNSMYLRKLGYGDYVEQLTTDAIRQFDARIDEYAINVAKHHQDGNREILLALDRLLDEIDAGR